MCHLSWSLPRTKSSGKRCTLGHFTRWCIKYCSTTANTHVICYHIDNVLSIQSKRSLEKARTTWVKTSYIVCVQRIKIQPFNSHQKCVMKHWFRLRTYFWQSITKHWYNWECLLRIDLQTIFSIVICNIETHFDADELGRFIQTNVSKLVPEQRIAYDRIMHAITSQSGGLYFLDAPGGTGKTFLLSLILATIRLQNKIALAIASSEIAATLLDGGRTAHSALKLPLNMWITETPTCNINKNGMGKVFQSCQLIIWDECTMAHKKALEALDHTLKDFKGNEKLFGGGLILLSGDFRQTLPVIPRSTAADEINACLKLSVLLGYVQKLILKTNMRVWCHRGWRLSQLGGSPGRGKISWMMSRCRRCWTEPPI